MSAEQLRAGIAAGQVTRGMHVRDESGAWAPIETSPFSSSLGAPLDAASTSNGETSGILILLTPLIGAGLLGLSVNFPDFFQSPVLTVLSGGTVATVAALITLEASLLGIGARPNKEGKVESGPVTWGFATLLIFIISFPWYLVVRSRYGKKNYVIGGAVVALAFTATAFLAGQMAETRSVLSAEELASVHRLLELSSAQQTELNARVRELQGRLSGKELWEDFDEMPVRGLSDEILAQTLKASIPLLGSEDSFLAARKRFSWIRKMAKSQGENYEIFVPDFLEENVCLREARKIRSSDDELEKLRALGFTELKCATSSWPL